MLTTGDNLCIIFLAVDEVWLSLVERCVRDAEVVGSNPVASTDEEYRKSSLRFSVFLYVQLDEWKIKEFLCWMYVC